MALIRKLSIDREWITLQVFTLFCWVIAACLPSSRWYRAALALARCLARIAGRFAPAGHNVTDASLVPRLLHRFLDLLAPHGLFPIPVVVEGEEHLHAYAAQPQGFVCCSAHIPFVKLFLPIARKVIGDERQRRIVAREPVGDNLVMAWNDEPWKAIRTDHAVLLHTRSLLRQNGCLLLAVDKEQGEFISSNIFRFVGKMNSRVLMWFTQLQPDGRILLRILIPPGPGCRNEEEIRANLDLVAENVRLILQGDTMTSFTKASAVSESSQAGPHSRDVHRIQLYSDTQLEAHIQRLQGLLHDKSKSVSQRDLLQSRLALMQAELRARAEGPARVRPRD